MIDQLIGRTVNAIYMNEDTLTLVTEEGPTSFYVAGDCCSRSYFFDFYGVETLLTSKITAAEEVALSPGDPGYRPETWTTPEDDYDDYKVYGYRLTVEDPRFGERSAVVSFRNVSNGYYGGWMDPTEHHLTDEEHRLTTDKIGEA